ncbi:hypothetical protein RHRU231_230173 [Rhodococcus ruber]|uniref:Uncharacterized protein n=1 Tax=Rhodococcus ruber TaxID=1830 RepID=A0A098BGI4_9NOCA|nr:hypothetical protein RHRU231_230173 [Rhodococcus ruber]
MLPRESGTRREVLDSDPCGAGTSRRVPAYRGSVRGPDWGSALLASPGVGRPMLSVRSGDRAARAVVTAANFCPAHPNDKDSHVMQQHPRPAVIAAAGANAAVHIVTGATDRPRNVAAGIHEGPAS